MDVLFPLRAIVIVPVNLFRRLNIACNLKSCYLQKHFVMFLFLYSGKSYKKTDNLKTIARAHLKVNISV